MEPLTDNPTADMLLTTIGVALFTAIVVHLVKRTINPANPNYPLWVNITTFLTAFVLALLGQAIDEPFVPGEIVTALLIALVVYASATGYYETVKNVFSK